MMKLTSEAVIDTFVKYCKEYGKLFVPDEKRDEAIVNSLISYYEDNYDSQLLIDCINAWIKTGEEPILIYNFAIESSKVRSLVLTDRQSRREFNDLLQQTRERMEALDK